MNFNDGEKTFLTTELDGKEKSFLTTEGTEGTEERQKIAHRGGRNCLSLPLISPLCPLCPLWLEILLSSFLHLRLLSR